IREIKCVRKHLSQLKGGRLASRAHPAPVATFAISDVPGDQPADIASGPTIPDATTQADALRILEGYGYPALGELEAVLGDARYETPKPGDAAFAGDTVQVIASAATALASAQRYLERHGFTARNPGDDPADGARARGRAHAPLPLEGSAAGRRPAL